MQTKYITFVNERLKHVDNELPNNTGWQTRHLEAITYPKNFESAIILLISSWLDYADIHKETYHSEIGNDGILGEAWYQMGLYLNDLLNGELGRLDAGTLHTIIFNELNDQGFTTP